MGFSSGIAVRHIYILVSKHDRHACKMVDYTFKFNRATLPY